MIAVVVGSGRCVWDDLHALRSIPDTYLAVNDMIVYSPHVDHAVSFHPDKLVHWVALRNRRPDRRPKERSIVAHSSRRAPGVDKAWPEYSEAGSSSLLATRIALAMGATRVLVAGVPLNDHGYIWSDPRVPKGYDFGKYRAAWDKNAEALKAAGVRGCSGYLAGLLGAAA